MPSIISLYIVIMPCPNSPMNTVICIEYFPPWFPYPNSQKIDLNSRFIFPLCFNILLNDFSFGYFIPAIDGRLDFSGGKSWAGF